MKRSFYAVLLLACLSIVSACAKGLSGTYVKCIALNSATSKKATYFIPDSSNFTYNEISYSSANCQSTPTTLPTSAGTYAQGASDVPGAQSIDFTFASGPLNATVLHQIYKLDSGNLFLGDTTTGSGATDALRPNAFETTPYVKQ